MKRVMVDGGNTAETGPEIGEVNFILVDTYSPYTAIVGRPWLHILGAFASSLH